MAALKVTSELVKRITKKNYEFITNFANTDMVGHTGNLFATKAVEILDKCLGEIYKSCKNGYTLIVTSDHGNADMMFDECKNLPCTTHSLNLPLL